MPRALGHGCAGWAIGYLAAQACTGLARELRSLLPKGQSNQFNAKTTELSSR